VCASFIPHLLAPDQKLQCSASSVEFVEMIDDDGNALKRIVMGDGSWCFMNDPETKRQSATWLRQKKSKSQKVRMQQSRLKNNVDLIFYAKNKHQKNTRLPIFPNKISQTKQPQLQAIKIHNILLSEPNKIRTNRSTEIFPRLQHKRKQTRYKELHFLQRTFA
jgi:hypothetical protein